VEVGSGLKEGTRVSSGPEAELAPGNTLAALMANQWPESSEVEKGALMYAGLVLLAITLLINIIGTLIQPVIWLLLFGQLFKSVADIPGFTAASYITFLTPGVVVMSAMLSAGWSGMSYVVDMERGVMDRFLVSRALDRLLPRQVQVLDGFLRIATARVVMRQLAVVLVQGGTVEGFHGLRRALMDGFASLLQDRPVGHFLRQGMFEAILDLRKGRLLVEKFFALERGQQPIEVVFRLGNDLTHYAQRKLPANNCELLQQGFLVWREAVDTGGENCLYGGRKV
jgi:hypothetical protein